MLGPRYHGSHFALPVWEEEREKSRQAARKAAAKQPRSAAADGDNEGYSYIELTEDGKPINKRYEDVDSTLAPMASGVAPLSRSSTSLCPPFSSLPSGLPSPQSLAGCSRWAVASGGHTGDAGLRDD